MSARKTKKTRATASTPAVAPIRELKAFYHGQPSDDFSAARFYWPAGAEPRESIAQHFLKKRRPAAADSPHDTAARIEVLLRADVGEDYTDVDFLVRSYEEKLAIDETAAFAQVTMRFPGATNLHGPYHRATSWLRSFYVAQYGVPVVAVLHAPHLAGSEASVHLHGLILMKRLSPFAWMDVQRDLASDAGISAARQSWADHLRA
jgi:hypothetical protein